MLNTFDTQLYFEELGKLPMQNLRERLRQSPQWVEWRGERGMSFLAYLAARQNLAAIRVVLEAAQASGVRVGHEIDEEGQIPLIEVVCQDCVETLHLLLSVSDAQFGCEVGLNALMFAANAARPRNMEVLLEALGPQSFAKLAQQQEKGLNKTALMFAVSPLVRSGRDPDWTVRRCARVLLVREASRFCMRTRIHRCSGLAKRPCEGGTTPVPMSWLPTLDSSDSNAWCVNGGQLACPK